MRQRVVDSAARAASWMLWSRKRASLTVIGLLMVLTVLSLTMKAFSPAPVDQAPAAGPTGPGVAGQQQTASSAPAEEQVVDVSDKFLRQWMRPGDDVLGWVERVRPYATGEVLTSLYTMDTDFIPKGKPVAVRLASINSNNALVRAELPGQVVLYVGLVPVLDGWKVNALTGSQE